ncbi:MAG TPA: ATP-binding protein [Candidatus Binatia bacterium]|jgi:signal transduction histidine kinase|nr:ATP-binding protein [Candidatus Binatia bacterium]
MGDDRGAWPISLEALTRRALPDVAAHLDAACDIVSAGPVAALLWLYDPAGSSFTLETCRLRAGAADVPPPRNCRVDVPARDVTARWEAAVALVQVPSLSRWAAANDLLAAEHDVPVRDPACAAAEPLGYLQFLASEPAPANADVLLDLIASRLGALLARRAEQTKANAVAEILRVQVGSSVVAWLTATASALRKATGAELCAVLTPQPDLTFRVVAVDHDRPVLGDLTAARESLCAQVARRGDVGRLRNFGDPEERQRVLHTTEFDADLVTALVERYLSSGIRAAMAGPVRMGEHSLALVLLLNKESGLSGEFSHHDEEVLRSVLALLASVIPSARLYDFVGEIARTETWGFLTDAKSRAALFDLLYRAVPGIVSASLRRTVAPGRPPETLELGTAPRSGAVRPNEAASTYEQDMPNLELPATLVLSLARAELSQYERRSVRFFAREIAQILRLDLHKRNETETFLQLQHVVKGGLAGVAGYTHELLSSYEVYKQQGVQSVLTQARFHKSLQRVRFYTKYVQTLIEQNRYLVGQMSRENLRIASSALDEIVREILRTVQPAFEQRELTFSFNNTIPGRQSTVSVDRGLIEVAIFNLMDNAIKYSYRRRSIEVWLGTERVGGRSQVGLHITNHGVLIASDDREVIFEPFTRRVTDPAAPLRSGTGLGLAIVRRVAEVHMGRITCESQLMSPSENVAKTTFFFRLPADRREAH